MNIQTKLIYLLLCFFLVYAFGFQDVPNTKPIRFELLLLKYILIGMLVSFIGYTVYCSLKENFVKSLKKTVQLFWGRQFVIDLYIGIFLFSFFLYMFEKSFSVLFVWLLPSIVFGNIIPLVYLITHFEMICGFFGFSN